MRSVARKYGIPHSTLHDHLEGKFEKVGRGGPTVLTAAEERQIVQACIALADMGFGVTRELVAKIVHDYVQENGIANPFTDGVPGRDWWQRFLKRWPSLSERKPQHLSKKRAEAGHEDIINGWFDRLERLFKTVDLDSSDPAIANRLWNCDETAFSMSASASKLLVRRGTRAVHEIGGGSGREYTTVHCAGSASGERLPPFLLYKGKNLYKRWTENGPVGALYGVNESGWMDAEVFLSWFCKLFLRAVGHLTESGPVILFLDGHHSHISLELIRKARANNVILQCLPPNTTHLLQPLDVGVFAPVKSAWKSILKRYKLETRGERVSKEVFPSLVAQLWDASFKPDHCKGGFRGAGLVPFSRRHVLQKVAPSSSTEGSRDRICSGDSSKVKCTSCGHEMATTPIIRSGIISKFSEILEVRKSKPDVGKRNIFKVHLDGETLPSDSFVELLADMAKKESEKEKKKKGKKGR